MPLPAHRQQLPAPDNTDSIISSGVAHRQNTALIKSQLSGILRYLLQTGRLTGSDLILNIINQKCSKAKDVDSSEKIKALIVEARNLQLIDQRTTVAEIAFYPAVSSLTLKPPSGIINPATIPGIPLDTNWFRTSGAVLVYPGGHMKIAVSQSGCWEEVLTLNHPVVIIPCLKKEGLAVCYNTDGTLTQQEDTSVLTENLNGFQITCKEGLTGSLLQLPYNLDLSDTQFPPVPADWSFPWGQSWYNPVLTGIYGSTSHEKMAIETASVKGIYIGASRFPDKKEIHICQKCQTNQTSEFDCKESKQTHYPDILIGTWKSVMSNSLTRLDKPTIYVKESTASSSVTIIGNSRLLNKTYYRFEACVTDSKNCRGSDCHSSEEQFTWTVSNPDIVEIIGSHHSKNIFVRSKNIGSTVIHLTCQTKSNTSHADLGLCIVNPQFVSQNNPRTPLRAIALNQPCPDIRITSISQPAVDKIDVKNKTAIYTVNLSGSIHDPLKTIRTVHILSGSHYRKALPIKKNQKTNFFTDERFSAFKVELSGPGNYLLRIKAQNSIQFWGSDTLSIDISIKQKYMQIIERLEIEYTDLYSQFFSFGSLEKKRKAIDLVWEKALNDPDISITKNVHYESQSENTKKIHRWSLAVSSTETEPAVILVSEKDRKTAEFTVATEKKLWTLNKPESCFAVHSQYCDSQLNWENDGLLRCSPQETLSVLSVDNECSQSIPVISISLEQSPDIQYIEKGTAVSLNAQGSPDALDHCYGQYYWTVESFPPQAIFYFEPAVSGSAHAVKFFTDTSGVYSFKVFYSIAGIKGPQTYAMVDKYIVLQAEKAKLNVTKPLNNHTTVSLVHTHCHGAAARSSKKYFRRMD